MYVTALLPVGVIKDDDKYKAIIADISLHTRSGGAI